MVSLSASELIEISRIAEQSGITNPKSQYSFRASNVEGLSAMISAADKKFRPLLISLLRHYHVIIDYREHLFKLLDRVSSKHAGTILMSPLMALSSEAKIKSGSHVLYEIKALAETDFPGKFEFRDAPDARDVLNGAGPSYAVDDFIGRGSQFLSMYNEMAEINPNRFISGVITIAILECGKQTIEALRLDVFAELIKRKAIAGYLSDDGADDGADVGEMYRIYDELESTISVPPLYARGYESGEALVSMKRTPDNTFTIFWHSGEGKKWPAAFPR